MFMVAFVLFSVVIISCCRRVVSLVVFEEIFVEISILNYILQSDLARYVSASKLPYRLGRSYM